MSKQSFKHIKTDIGNFKGKLKASLEPNIKQRLEGPRIRTVYSVTVKELQETPLQPSDGRGGISEWQCPEGSQETA